VTLGEHSRFNRAADDRRVFADGALTAARWLASARLPAVYTMRDVLAASQAPS
jgi:4-hydroxy-tetrahydrodipicolinate reductase